MPFIIRGVSLLGIASAGTARDIRDASGNTWPATGNRSTSTGSRPAKSGSTNCPAHSRAARGRLVRPHLVRIA